MTNDTTTSLDDWQETLVNKFDEVTFRKLDLPQQPVTFALEHGLNAAERAQLSTAIHASVSRQEFRRKHYLCWAAYAAELGYLYAGNEYWHTFREQTPGWHPRHRPFIKICFVHFADQYNGAIPQGAWAHHRSIICWPITHSILPKDLQRQLAQILFRIRHNVVIEDVESPRQLGQLIAGRSGDATSRFQQLASEPDLMGQIAAALLLEDQTLNLIETRTLSRIAADLNVEEQARTWLQDAKHHLSRRARVSGLMRQGVARREPTEPSTPRPPRPLIRPSLSLRPVGDNQWRLVIDVPSLLPLTRTYDEFQSVVARASFCVGNGERAFAARALLHGGQTYVQPVWPEAGKPLLAFSPTHPDLDALLQHACTLEPGPWLFRIGVDGKGREIRSRRVSENGEYIVVGESNSLAKMRTGEPAELACLGASARRFVATSLDVLADVLPELGLQAARKVVVRPVGLVPTGWDGEGHAEWLATDQAVIGLSANFAIERYDVQVDIGSRVLALTATPGPPTEPTFVQLPSLPAGEYHVFVSATPHDPTYQVEQGDMEIVIRDPAPDSERSRARTALLMALEPGDATYNDVFDGTLLVQGFGPHSRDVRPSLRLRKKNTVAPLFATDLQAIQLPISADDWSKRISQLGHDAAYSRAYHEADTCELTFDAGDLGLHHYSFDRPFTPLRWGTTLNRDRPSITLYDDIDNPDSIEVLRFEFSTPLKPRLVTDKELKKASEGAAAPGLYLARSDPHATATIVPMQTIEELRAVRHRFLRPERSAESVSLFLDSIDLWGTVDTTGNVFGRHAWRLVLKALVQQLTGLISGSHWYKEDLAFGRKPQIQRLAARIPYKAYGADWPVPLTDAVDEMSLLSLDERIERMSGITGTTIETCQFALRLTSNPIRIRELFDDRFDVLLNELMRRSEVVRAARFLVLATGHHAQLPEKGSRTIYAGWQWN